jgi:hypothetical protein
MSKKKLTPEEERAKDRFEWTAALLASNLDPIDKLVGIRLAMHCNLKDGTCNPSKTMLAAGTNLSPRRVYQAIHTLSATGWVGVEQSKGRHANGHQLTIPTVHDGAPLTGHDDAPFDPANRARNGPQPCTDPPPTVHTTCPQNSMEHTEQRERNAHPQTIDKNWCPSADDSAFAEGQGLSGERIEAEAQKFVHYHRADGKAKADWSAAWCMWIYRAIERGDGSKGNGTRPQADKITDRRQAETMVRIWKGGTWPYEWGPEPDQPGCRIVPEILRDLDVRPACDQRHDSRL